MPDVLRSRRVTVASRTESFTLALGVAGVLVGLVVGLAVLRGTSTLSGEGSIGQLAAVTSGGTSAVVAAVTMAVIMPQRRPWVRTVPRLRRALTILGPSLVYAVLALLLTSAMYGILAEAFRGVALDRFASTFWVALTTGAWAYVVAASSWALSGRSLATLLMVFLTVGVLAAAMLSPDPYWWEQYFSQLGEGADTAGRTFNLTLLLTGLAFVAVGDFVAHDLQRWTDAAGEPRWKVHLVRGTLIALGALLALVALVSRTVSVDWHNRLAEMLVVVFALALIVFPVLLRRLPGGLLVFTGVAFAVLVMLIVLFEGVDYLNMTAFELGAAVTVYIWLLLFIRTVSAAGEGVAAEDDAEDDAAQDDAADDAVTHGGASPARFEV
ncbi:DUF998 domain-containing protein [Brachybacterium aquaticum]|uniref:Putative membrane protein n=1 Tax=Brachybacterium aquaticum TaxID=1432564 RepID=A0A841AEP1_9MICO|nr:DUF998 domain-containing protein [Brachybacterium aquaticum]MBB5831604.1 putative membrane protein [Brachybacterium aquaticum]